MVGFHNPHIGRIPFLSACQQLFDIDRKPLWNSCPIISPMTISTMTTDNRVKWVKSHHFPMHVQTIIFVYCLFYNGSFMIFVRSMEIKSEKKCHNASILCIYLFNTFSKKWYRGKWTCDTLLFDTLDTNKSRGIFCFIFFIVHLIFQSGFQWSAKRLHLKVWSGPTPSVDRHSLLLLTNATTVYLVF